MRIAVIGSGPTALDWQAQEDVSIGLNAAITLPYPLDYWIAVDNRVPERDYWQISKGEQRILGPLVAKQETRPHVVLQYQPREWPDIEADTIGLCGNVAHAGLEFAYRLMPDEIVLYGIDLGRRRYFAGDNLGGTYGGIQNTGKCLHYMQALIDMIRAKGITVTVKGSEDCRIH